MAAKTKEKSGSFPLFFLDALMIFLLVVNLNWIILDWIFEVDWFRDQLSRMAPEFADYYATRIHPRFFLIDLMFVSVFLTEFFIRWALAVWYRVYHRWFFFPFIHFYDLLGCVPVGGFRFLRLLRIVSITYRLQKSGIINLENTALFSFLRKYYGILMEELSDRVTLNILDDLQQEVLHGGPVVEKILHEVVLPQKEPLVDWISHRIEIAAGRNYERYQGDVQEYIQERINFAVEENRELGRLDHLPLVGPAVRNILEKAVSDIVFHVIDGVIQDMASPRNRMVVDEVAGLLFEAVRFHDENEKLNEAVTDIVYRSLDIIKKQISLQQWKIRDLAQDEKDFKQRMRAALMDQNE